MNTRVIRMAMIFVLSILMYGCATTNSIPYKASTANVVSLQQTLKPEGIKVTVGEIAAADGVEESVMCRMMGPVKVAPGKTLSQYIKEAFEEELFMAQVYDPNSQIVLNGRIEQLSFSSIAPANWKITLSISSNRNPGYTVAVDYKFNTSFDAWSACRNVADAFGPAVQELLKQVVSDARFKSLVL